jgi:hypothetical protein
MTDRGFGASISEEQNAQAESLRNQLMSSDSAAIPSGSPTENWLEQPRGNAGDGGRGDSGYLAVPNTPEKAKSGISLGALALPIVFFVGALAASLFVVFVMTDPQNPGLGWYGDVYHHWQIAFLSQEVGFSEGFLRLWDFKGLEFFWGLLHPLTLIALFNITGSIDIVIPRLVSVFFGAVSVTFLFLLLRRYFGLGVAIAGALLAGFNPISIYSDSVGMQEPLGLALLLGGLLLLERRPAFAGICWALAGMVRAEYWVFGAGLLFVALISQRYRDQRIPLAIGWAAPTLLYMKYMLDYTGNPIYPIYWNFLAGTAGRWMEDVVLNTEQLAVRLVARIILILSVAAAGWVLWRRPKGKLFLLLGLGNIIMLGIVLGLGKYINGYITRVLVDRLLALPYGYIGIFLAIALLYVLPRHMPRRSALVFGWAAIIAVFGVAQLVWEPLMGYYDPLRGVWEKERVLADEVAARYQSGTISIPEDRQALTYALARFHGIEGKNLDGQMYDPFAYIEGNPFTNWDQNRQVIRAWLVDRDISMLVFYRGKANYEEMVAREPGWFVNVGSAYDGAVLLYRVRQNGDSS